MFLLLGDVSLRGLDLRNHCLDLICKNQLYKLTGQELVAVEHF